MWLVGSGVPALVRGDLVKLRAASTDARRGLPGALGEVGKVAQRVSSDEVAALHTERQ